MTERGGTTREAGEADRREASEMRTVKPEAEP